MRRNVMNTVGKELRYVPSQTQHTRKYSNSTYAQSRSNGGVHSRVQSNLQVHMQHLHTSSSSPAMYLTWPRRLRGNTIGVGRGCGVVSERTAMRGMLWWGCVVESEQKRERKRKWAASARRDGWAIAAEGVK